MSFDSVSAADVSIVSMTATGTRTGDHVEITTTIVINNQNDDDAPNVNCLVVFPPTSRVLSSLPAAAIGPSYGPVGAAPQFVQSEATNGYAMFAVGSPMPNDAAHAHDLTLTVVTRVHEDWATRPIAAFVSSDLPDPDPSNNCATTTPTIRVRPHRTKAFARP